MKKRERIKLRVAHVRTRASERFNMCLTREDMREIVGKITSNRTLNGMRLTSSRSAILVEHNDEIFTVIYSKSQKCIVTVLPKTDEKHIALMEGAGR